MASGQSDQGRNDPLETLRGAFWVIALAVIVLYAFFGVLGAFWIGNILPLTILVCVLAALWLVHAAFDRRHHDEEQRDPRLRTARQRRGF